MFGCFSYGTTEYGSVMNQGSIEAVRVFPKNLTILSTFLERGVLSLQTVNKVVLQQRRENKNVVELKSNNKTILHQKADDNITL